MWNKFKNFVGGIPTGIKAVIVFWILFILFITSVTLFPAGTMVAIILLSVCWMIAMVSAIIYVAFS